MLFRSIVGDRIAVLDRGVLQQVGTPEELRAAPANELVAEYTGRTGG